MSHSPSETGFPCRRGDFVDCLFPFARQPTTPGLIPQIVYVQSLVRHDAGDLRALVMLATNSPRLIRTIPRRLCLWVREAALAPVPGSGLPTSRRREIGTLSGSLVIDLHRFALLPLDERWFPCLNHPRFVVARSDRRLEEAVTRRYAGLREMYPDPQQTH